MKIGAFDREASEVVDIDWDGLGFGLVQTDFMYIMQSSSDGTFNKGELLPFGPIQLNPSSAVLNYGQVSCMLNLDSDFL